ncbi:MAG: response regulator [Bacteroidetes bacterium]|nr:response regulator [Bacteroidota bacterium]
MTYLDATILIVDDKAGNIAILEELLKMQGYKQIHSTSDSRNVLEMFNSYKPDIILLDLMMPYLSGYEVLTQLKEVIPTGAYLPILVLTADITSVAKRRALAEGATDFLPKPFDLIEVGLRIKNMLFARVLYLEMENQNINLENKVKERTLELLRNNKELVIAKDRAQASDRLKTAFLNNISHEIRTPLSGIIGFASFIIKPDITQKEKEGHFEVLKRNSARLTNTVNDYMDISLIVSGNMVANNAPVDCFYILQALHHDFYEHCVNKNLEFKLQYLVNPVGLILDTDKEMLIKALSHILNNAIKFTASGSITLGFQCNDDKAIFFIKDTGIGVDLEAQKRISAIFIQEDNSMTRSYEGSGLGLSIASGLIKLIGGSVHLVSGKTHGTSVFATLPMSPKVDEEEIELAIEPNWGKKFKTIVIAEPDDLNYEYLHPIFEKLADTLVRAKTSIETIEICNNDHSIDFVILNTRMPRINGYTVVKEIRKFNKEVVLFALVSGTADETLEMMIQEGYNNCLTMPVSQIKLDLLISEYFNK